MVGSGNPQKLFERVRELEAKLKESEETLEAIRRGEIDALVISGDEGEQIYTLRTADHPYRILVEAMSEGAVTLSRSGVILYCNPSFAVFLQIPVKKILGKPLSRFIAPIDRPRFEALFRQCQVERSRSEIILVTADQKEAPALLSLNPLPPDEFEGVSVVVTDLREQKRQHELVASEKLLRSILEQAAEATVVCDERGIIIQASHRAHELCACNTALRHFDEVLPLFEDGEGSNRPQDSGHKAGRLKERFTFSEILKRRELRGVEAVLQRIDGKSLDLLLSAAMVNDNDGKILGCVVTMMDITTRKEAEDERERQLAREQQLRTNAEEASRLKDEFLAIVSHELKTPLNAINGWAEMLRSGGLKPDQSHTAIETIARNAKTQMQIIDDLLDVSRIITGKMRLNVAEIIPAKVVAAAIETIHHAAEAKSIKLTVQSDPEVGVVMGDFERLQQVIWNLLSNAIKFTPDNGQVEVRIRSVDSHVMITVNDNGQGINTKFLPYVFDRFRQEDGTTRRRHGGMGLGLAIVRQIVELHGGTVSVESPGELRGATFTISLPSRSLSSRKAPWEFYGNSETDGEMDSFFRAVAGARVLLVDDEPDALTLVRMILEKGGAVVQAAGNALEAHTILTEWRPDLIISDIGMAHEDGYDFIQRIRTNGESIPAVALTAYTRAEDRMRALASGFQMHVSKPVEPEELLTVVASLIGRNTG